MKPIAWYDPTNGMVSTDKDCPLFTPLGQVWGLYLKEEWVGLTDAEIAKIFSVETGFALDASEMALLDFAQAIEAKLKEKNA
jgi:hypothetical protein